MKDATTVLPWRGGLIGTAAPDILYFKNTNGEAKADKKEVLFSGFLPSHHHYLTIELLKPLGNINIIIAGLRTTLYAHMDRIITRFIGLISPI